MHSLSSVVFCLSIHNNPYICFSKNLLTFNALTLYYFYMKEISTILWMAAIWMIGLMPVRAAAGVPGRDLQSEKGETVICRGVEAHTSGPMLQVGQIAPDFHAVNAKMEEVSLSDFKGKKVILNIFPSLDTPTCALSVRQFNARAAGLETRSCYACPWTCPSHSHVSVLPKGWIMSFRCPYSAAVILSHTTVSS